ncbi:uncharacterized protein LOC134832012 isoform X1 [Culicoides brevitarsis]|uniref:uncharacterized protein LOC134832012 isoform X1 n=1 Tax=Culicoides brevitarsis TaxID=469753 RepID=UPI00307B73A9
MSDNSEMFDGVLLGLAEKHPGGVPDLLKTIAEFLGRKTDFFTGAGEDVWKKMLLSIFEEAAKKSVAEHKEKMAKRAEAERKRKEEQAKKAKLESDQSGVTELTEEEAEALQKEIDAKKNPTSVESTSNEPKKKKVAPVKSAPGEELSKPIEATGDAEDDKEVGKLMPNSGNGANMEKYSWTQTLSEVETTSDKDLDGTEGETSDYVESDDDEEFSSDDDDDNEANKTVIEVNCGDTEDEIELKIVDEKEIDKDVKVPEKQSQKFVSFGYFVVRSRNEQLRNFWPPPKVHLKKLRLDHHPPQNIFPGCYQLPLLIEQMYDELERNHPIFTSLVSESAFAYYCAVVVYNRILHLRKMNGEVLTTDEMKFIKQVDALNLRVPCLLQCYIAGMGNVTIQEGHIREKFRFKTHPITYVTAADSSMGWFGRVAAETHFLYQKYPCLTVFAKRIVEEVGFEKGNSPVWNLPEDIAPANEEAGFPSENLLGYGPLQPLRASQKIFLKRCGISEPRFPTANDTFCLCLKLLSEIRRELVAEKQLKLFSSKIHGENGSVAQLPYHRLTEIPKSDMQSDIAPIEADGPFRQFSKYRFPNALHVASLKFQYQIECVVKNDGPNLWSIYDFDGFQKVPIDWCETMKSQNNGKIDKEVNYSTQDQDWADLVNFNFDINAKEWLRPFKRN